MLPVLGGHHPAVLPLTLTHRHRSYSGLRWSETVLGVLTEAGIEAEDRVVALRAVIAYVIGATQLEHLGPLAGPGTIAIAALPEDEPVHVGDRPRRPRRHPGPGVRRRVDPAPAGPGMIRE
ncbi:TetR/AcrR family transcriptional regulator C-terminal domain-containing protein [Streptomyces sp. NPDC092307]|uniref:TetR/AcrR family transcriptional regulator C-terminal domain-containing protein n=1 Tax=Streptomyces sp. NPDC092307 TaxID=3366013 RepID=UPI00382F97AC